MKYFIATLCLIFLVIETKSQTVPDTINLKVKNINLEQLKSPTNPAFILMNTSPTEIVVPGSGPEFITSIQNASNDFSALPNNYGFSVTPFWWTNRAKHLAFEDDFDTVNHFRFFRTLGISGGIVQGVESDETWRYGLGFQTALLRGKIDNAKKIAYKNSLRDYHKSYYAIDEFYYKDQNFNLLDQERNTIILNLKDIDIQIESGSLDPETAAQQKIMYVKKLGRVQNELDSLKRILAVEFNEKAQTLESSKPLDDKFNDMNERVGLKWDIGGGLAYSSENNKIDSTGLYRIGFWSDFGGNLIAPDSASTKLSGFLLLRYLYYKEILYAKEAEVIKINNLSLMDFGGRLQLDLSGKFSLGVEGIYRLGIAGSVFESTYKINGNVQYQVGKNKLVYASFGNKFNDQSNTGPEDFIITFGFNLGFGGNIDVYGVNF